MGRTKRKDGYYVEFPVIDDGKVLTLARGTPGAKVKRWRVGCRNKTMAQDQETIIKNKLLNGTMVSVRAKLAIMTFGQWAKEYVEIEEVKCLRSYTERCQRITVVLVPFFGKTLLQDITAKDVEAFRQEPGGGACCGYRQCGSQPIEAHVKACHEARFDYEECGVFGHSAETKERSQSSART